MGAAILEIRDGIAGGPIHDPAGKLGEDEYPLNANAVCGVNGYVYRREALAELKHTGKCLNCYVMGRLRAAKPQRPPYFRAGPLRYATEEERRAARLATYRRYYERCKAKREAT